MECAYYLGIPGGWHMESAYYFDLGRLCLMGIDRRSVERHIGNVRGDELAGIRSS